jgi:signal peptidase I
MIGALLVGATACAALATAVAMVVWTRRRLVVVTVDGPSMHPTYSDGDRVLVRRSEISVLRTGDVVVVQRPDDDGQWRDHPGVAPSWLVKRVVALPGCPVPVDRVPVLSADAATHVPAGKLVLLGDNSANSYDSRYIGYFPSERLLGVVVRSLVAAT